MPEVIWCALIAGVVTMAGSLLTFVSANKKTKAEQFQRMEEYNNKLNAQIASFRDDTRIEVSKLQDAVADHKVSTQTSIKELQNAQERFQGIVELKLNALEKKQDEHNNVITRMFKLEQRVEDMQEKGRITS